MLTYKEMERLPENERAVTRASHDYYQALLKGASASEQHRLRQAWLQEIHRRWPDTSTAAEPPTRHDL
jgi:hypothetical protein